MDYFLKLRHLFCQIWDGTFHYSIPEDFLDGKGSYPGQRKAHFSEPLSELPGGAGINDSAKTYPAMGR